MSQLVSVVIPTKGSRRNPIIFERCLPSLMAQTYRPLEILIVSGGGQSEIGTELGRMGVRFLEIEEEAVPDVGNQARNAGAAAAQGEYVAYLDDDSAYRPQHVANLAALLQADPRLDFVYSAFAFHPDLSDQYQLRGAPPPVYAHIDCSAIMHRRGFLERYGRWPVPNMYPDAEAAALWVRNGASWEFSGEPSYDYYALTPGLDYPGRERERESRR